MEQNALRRRKTSFRQETGGYVPRQFNAVTRERFLRDRRQKHLSRVTGPPTDSQVAQVQSLATLEWAALSAEHDNVLQSLREAREHRRLFLRVLADFEQTLAPQSDPRPRGRARSGPPQITLEEHLALLRQRQGSAA